VKTVIHFPVIRLLLGRAQKAAMGQNALLFAGIRPVIIHPLHSLLLAGSGTPSLKVTMPTTSKRLPANLCLRFALAFVSFSSGAARLAAGFADDSVQADPSVQEQPIGSTFELQVELHRRGFSCGSIDGVPGLQTSAALDAYQRSVGIPETGLLDAETRQHLKLSAPPLGSYTFTAIELAGLHPEPKTWLEKSQLPGLGYESALELAAERFHSHPNLIRKLNPAVNWAALLPGIKIVVPAVDRVTVSGIATQIVITLGANELEVFDTLGRVIAHFPVSIARMVVKRPVGSLHVTVVIPNPDYTFDPELFPESEEGRMLARNLVVPPGPNNPVGVAWIGLDKPGYGIHGTPEPENVGRTESHGCFRLANWDVLTLVSLVAVGMSVSVQ
jgi:lipoprotein-anchoring transpeptidase ErfK/SrfK